MFVLSFFMGKRDKKKQLLHWFGSAEPRTAPPAQAYAVPGFIFGVILLDAWQLLILSPSALQLGDGWHLIQCRYRRCRGDWVVFLSHNISFLLFFFLHRSRKSHVR